LLEHVSTIDVVRDLELLRRAVGDPQLNFIGVSYGTFLGAVYANLFPGNVRAMVLDGNVDPVAWTNGGKEFTFLSTSLRLGSDIAAADTLDAFLDLCGQASTDQCAFSAGSPSATHAKWKTLLQRVREHPVGTDGQTITYAALSSAMVAWLTTTEPLPGSFKGWVYAANVLQALWQTTTPGAAPDSAMPADPIAFTPETTSQSYEGIEQQFAVECSESPNPRDPLVFQALDLLSFARAGDVGPYLSWGDEGCASWPSATERYNGPWDGYTASPILVIGNTLDPDTPYKGAIAMANDLARGRLLTVQGYGHTTLLNPSTCANDYETQYLVDGKLPPSGTVCHQDTQPFTSSQ
jgi:pimeloyl-ACP methyl ester carboxylesterase